MNIYEYNSSTFNQYSTEDCGLITNSMVEIFDCGKILDNYIEVLDYNFILHSNVVNSVGIIKIKSGTQTKYKKVSSEFNKVDNLNKKSIILHGIILTWYGYGTLFEFDNGLERQVIPDVSGGGKVS